mmetsp:Transcript_23797/g.44189  ORF Transcript_23797/g.44189 Transcript_23797/m.44189 type:complete len:143 (+) Transcript_23797:250-678(+)
MGSVPEVCLVGPEGVSLDAKDGFPAVIATQRDGIDLVITKFTGRWLVHVSDLGKIGTVLECSKDDRVKTFEVDVVLGDRHSLWLRVLGRQLVELVHPDIRLVVSTGIKLNNDNEEEAKAKIKTVLEMFRELVGSPVEGTSSH